jgi:hypothetical protein
VTARAYDALLDTPFVAGSALRARDVTGSIERP